MTNIFEQTGHVLLIVKDFPQLDNILIFREILRLSAMKKIVMVF